MPDTIQNIMSVDCESWVHMLTPEFDEHTVVERKRIDNEDIVRECEFLLNELAKRSIRLTWFIVAEIAEWYPSLIDSILQGGHEIGYHTFKHRYLHELTTLQDELSHSRDFLKEYHPVAFQAPRIILHKSFYEHLAKYGFKYSLSVYGDSSRCEVIDGILECPVSAWRFRNTGAAIEYPSNMDLKYLSHSIPFGSSFWYGFGYTFINHFIQKFHAEHKRVNMFIHNWQLTPPSGAFKQQRHRFYLKEPLAVFYAPNVRSMFFKMMDNYRWGPATEILDSVHDNQQGSRQ